MAGFNLQNAVDQGILKVASATAADKSIKQQDDALNLQNEKINKEKEKEDSINKEKLITQELNYGLEFDKSEADLYQHELDVANEMRKESGKNLNQISTQDINDYYDSKRDEYYGKYNQAVSDRDKAMNDPRYIDKRTRAGRKFAKAERDMDMYRKARAEITQQTNLHNELVRKRQFYKQQLLEIHKEMDIKDIKYDRDNTKYDIHNRVKPV